MKNSAQGSQTVARAIGLLRLVSSRAKEGMRVQEIVDAGELSRPTVHRLLSELVECGLLMRSSERRFFLGQFAYELGISAASHFHLKISVRHSSMPWRRRPGIPLFWWHAAAQTHSVWIANRAAFL